jgi:hypothetical protein
VKVEAFLFSTPRARSMMHRCVRSEPEVRTVMSKIILNEDQCSKLNGVSSTVEVCNESGQTVGFVLSEEFYTKLMYAWIKSQPIEEDLELQQALKEKGGRPLAEIWKSLGVK